MNNDGLRRSKLEPYFTCGVVALRDFKRVFTYQKSKVVSNNAVEMLEAFVVASVAADKAPWPDT